MKLGTHNSLVKSSGLICPTDSNIQNEKLTHKMKSVPADATLHPRLEQHIGPNDTRPLNSAVVQAKLGENTNINDKKRSLQSRIQAQPREILLVVASFIDPKSILKLSLATTSFRKDLSKEVLFARLQLACKRQDNIEHECRVLLQAATFARQAGNIQAHQRLRKAAFECISNINNSPTNVINMKLLVADDLLKNGATQQMIKMTMEIFDTVLRQPEAKVKPLQQVLGLLLKTANTTTLQAALNQITNKKLKSRILIKLMASATRTLEAMPSNTQKSIAETLISASDDVLPIVKPNQAQEIHRLKTNLQRRVETPSLSNSLLTSTKRCILNVHEQSKAAPSDRIPCLTKLYPGIKNHTQLAHFFMSIDEEPNIHMKAILFPVLGTGKPPTDSSQIANSFVETLDLSSQCPSFELKSRLFESCLKYAALIHDDTTRTQCLHQLEHYATAGQNSVTIEDGTLSLLALIKAYLGDTTSAFTLSATIQNKTTGLDSIFEITKISLADMTDST